MATTPLLLAFSSRAWYAGSGGAVLSTATLLDVALPLAGGSVSPCRGGTSPGPLDFDKAGDLGLAWFLRLFFRAIRKI